MRTETVAAYSVYGGSRPLRHVTLSDASAEVSLGRARWVCRRCSSTNGHGRCKLGGGEHQMVVQFLAPERRDGASSTSLTHYDAQANVGIDGSLNDEPGIPANEAMVESVRAKIGWWPLVGDSKAVRVGPAA